MTIKSRSLLLVLGLQLVAVLCVALFAIHTSARRDAGQGRSQAAKQIALEAMRVEVVGGRLERAAVDLAALGSLLHAQSEVDSAAWLAQLQSSLLAHFSGLPEAIGGGLWFEPDAIESGRQRFGPYVFRAESGLEFTWDLSTEAYNYHNQPWYLTGLPRDWPRDRRRPKAIYWSEPYRDKAGSQSLMLTASAPIHDSEGRVVGLATVDWPLDGLRELVSRLAAPGGRQVFLIERRSGKLLVYSPDPRQVMQPVAAQAWADDLLPRLRGGEPFDARVELAGVPHDLHLQPAVAGLSLGSLTPAPSAMKEILRRSPSALGWALLTALPLLLLTWLTLNRQFRPMDQLLAAIRQSLARDGADDRLLLRPIAMPVQPEFRPLVDTLNSVFSEIHRDREQLIELGRQLHAQQAEFAERQASLEKRVNERTFELEANNAELQRTVSALTRLQEQLIEAEKQGSLGRLVAGIAHDINTPLGIAVTAASHLHDQFNAQRDALAEAAKRSSGLRRMLEDGDEGYRMLLANLERAAALVRSFKQISVDQSGEGRRHFELKAYLDELLLSLRPQFKRLPHRVELECPRGIELDSYPGAWAQIVTNLVMNALRHGLQPERAGQIMISASQSDDQLELRVKDDGAGIPADSLPRIFDAFYTTGASQGGSGLGLAVVRDLVEQRLGGRIEVRSTPGEGAEFIVRAPRVTASNGQAG